MVHGVAAGLDQRQAVVAWIEVEEEGPERLEDVVAQAEAEDILIERLQLLDVLDVQHHVAHAERAGAEAGKRAARLERRRGDLRAMEGLKRVSGRVMEANDGLHAAR